MNKLKTLLNYVSYVVMCPTFLVPRALHAAVSDMSLIQVFWPPCTF